ncbi:MAG: hypothetical protein H0X54_11440 [Propionibacteriales bacterium]|nr:hypothetical protein [Propionibacteriales bacterium]
MAVRSRESILGGQTTWRPPSAGRERVMDALKGMEARGAIGPLTLQTAVPPPAGAQSAPTTPAPPPPSWMTKDDDDKDT